MKNANLLRLVQAFRYHGHRLSDIDPLGLSPKESIPALDPARYGIPYSGVQYDLTGILDILSPSGEQKSTATIEEILAHLRETYTGRIAYEFEHVTYLTDFKVFDHFMAKKFPHVKRYGLEGAESMMIVLDTIFREANYQGVREVVLGMPHRGRLNLLADLLQYPLPALFHKIKGNSEFHENDPATGDVISHLAQTVDLSYAESKNRIRVSLLNNPSHLEAVNPVAMGEARARQMGIMDDGTEGPDCTLGDRVLCVQLHGDAAFCGQGVVTETLGLSNLPHFTSGGSIHVIVNNQIGYTTAAMNARSSIYTSDVGKMIACPIIHVNADNPEDVVHATAIAAEYRNKFKKDIILDMIAYRRWGHNELDEPAFTQPLMYNNIRNRKSVPALYEQNLLSQTSIFSGGTDEVEIFKSKYFEKLEFDLGESANYHPKETTLKSRWTGFKIAKNVEDDVDTGVDIEALKKVGKASVTAPEGMKLHPRLQKYHIDARLNKLESGKNLDWATCEALAFGSVLLEGNDVRLSGQDVGRGTFSQRHAMFVDQETEKVIVPLNHMTHDTPSSIVGKLELANSSLSEFAVLGFEYGMSAADPNRMVLWEAQFGDFFNGAQIIIDTYISSGETKWLTSSGIVMLLPHGYDGAGPEHSSARIERFLQLSDQRFDVLKSEIDNPNMHIANPTTPAQYFHLLRRQMKRSYRKPLIVFTPKILLRHPAAVSQLLELTPGTTFKPILTFQPHSSNKFKHVIFCSGKIVYDMIKLRKETNLGDDVAIISIEELTPFPTKRLVEAIKGFSAGTKFIWVQVCL
ncbi:hypothetical protein HK098_000847 [Nowakowskiella sp. JEL0407]|nr:hypothetical protein HK098_000847 [Nowakowskiella sp. JEL0407]